MKGYKVLMFGWEYAPIVTGGLGIVCRDLSEQLIKKGLQIDFVLPKLPRQIAVDDKLTIINASQYEVEDKYLSISFVNAFLNPYTNTDSYQEQLAIYKNHYLDNTDGELYGLNLFAEIQRFAARAFEIAIQSNPDVIHVHDWMTFKAGVNAKKVTGKPLIMHVHATEYDRSGGHPHQQIFAEEAAGLAFADKIIAVSERTKNTLVDLYKIDPNKIEVVHNAIKNESTPIVAVKDENLKSKREKIILFLGRMSIQKGADYLLHAAAKVLKKRKDVKFVFVGKGDMLKKLISLSIELGISKNVVFAGFLNHEEVDLAYNNADLFVMPSVSEPFGITSLEAVKNGVPVLMSKQSGAGEVMHNCLKVDYWDTDEMADKIFAVIEHGVLAGTLTSESYQDLNALNWSKQADRVITIYQDLIK